MRVSNMFARTLRESPADAKMVSHQLSIRAGLIRQMAAGIYSYLPSGWRAIRRIAGIIREEMDAIGGQEISMPIVQPAELWKATGRYDADDPGAALLRFRDRGDHERVLAMTHEEAVTELAGQLIRSYRQLPMMVYQLQTKYRDEPRARGGLVRAREFMMKDGYSFHTNALDLDAYYVRVLAAYERIFDRCGLETIPVEAATGMMGGATSHELVILNEHGEDAIVTCPACSYAANSEAAVSARGEGVVAQERPLERVATPGTTTIEALARYLGVETRQTLKAVFYRSSDGELVFAIIRGDLDVAELKLSRVLGGVGLQPADGDDLVDAGLVPGYASPIGVTGVRVVADDSIRSGTNFVAGANEPGYHLLNVNYPRDFGVETIADIALARDGDRCPHCSGRLSISRAIEVGHIFQLGTKYCEAMGANYLDGSGASHPVQMGCYGIGLGRLMACIIEQHHDEHGIVWPLPVAPFDLHLVSLGPPGSDVAGAADRLYERLRAGGHDILYDDRNERPGVKSNDADLIGTPIRLTVSRRTVAASSVELKVRWETVRRMIPDAELEAIITETQIRGAGQNGRSGET